MHIQAAQHTLHVCHKKCVHTHVTLLQQKGVLRFKQRWGGGVIVLNNLLAEHFIRMLAAAHQILCAAFPAEGFTIFIKCLAKYKDG